ncbi:hypothetical protein [Bacteroides timonensis]|uniref:hypothetical protein n=1 Tax=Bacteroides timonensis TaxID=1470345 RepID=UPI0004ADE3E9|nr:hypothetical protein [Bacteroides timonensis]
MKLKYPHMTRNLFRKNYIAYKLLKLFGFSIYPNVTAGEGHENGIIYMVISSAKLEPDDNWLVKRG